MKWGTAEIDLINDGMFMLDGGAMFGIVPKVIWNRSNPADENNRIKLRASGLLIRTEGENILVDTGVGTKLNPKNEDIYGFTGSLLLKNLEERGLTAEDIDKIVCTHLHFDHNGGGTFFPENGKAAPVFPNARYVIQKQEIEEATHKNERTRASYFDEDIIPLLEGGLVDSVEGEEEIIPGISVELTGGHTGGHQTVHIESEGQRAVFLGDLIPTTTHLRIPYIMAYDLYPMEVIEKKKELLQEAFQKKWLLIFQHDPYVKMGYLEKGAKGFILKEEECN